MKTLSKMPHLYSYQCRKVSTIASPHQSRAPRICSFHSSRSLRERRFSSPKIAHQSKNRPVASLSLFSAWLLTQARNGTFPGTPAAKVRRFDRQSGHTLSLLKSFRWTFTQRVKRLLVPEFMVLLGGRALPLTLGHACPQA